MKIIIVIVMRSHDKVYKYILCYRPCKELFTVKINSSYLHPVEILMLSVPDIGNHISVTIIIFACPEVRTVWMCNLFTKLAVHKVLTHILFNTFYCKVIRQDAP